MFACVVPFSLFKVPLCALVGTFLDGVCPKDASNDAPGFGGDYVESQQSMIRIW